jgi:hypothetical protein
MPAAVGESRGWRYYLKKEEGGLFKAKEGYSKQKWVYQSKRGFIQNKSEKRSRIIPSKRV